MHRKRLIVLKFGGSVLLEAKSLSDAVREIDRWRSDGYRVVAVVSAIAGRTDELLACSAGIDERPAPHAVAAVASIGELESAALLLLQLERAGIAAECLSPGAAGLIAEGDPLDADPVQLNTRVIHAALERKGVLVFPGYVAIDDKCSTVVLGRGGSDLTALFLAHQLGADQCRLIKDVDGLYEWDPANKDNPPMRYRAVTFADALATDGSIIQHKAVRFACLAAMQFELGAIESEVPTIIGAQATAYAMNGLRRPTTTPMPPAQAAGRHRCSRC